MPPILTTSLAQLVSIDFLNDVSFSQYACYVHTDHRWVLPLIFEAQSLGLVPKPATLVAFDWHTGALVPDDAAKAQIRTMVQNGFTLADVITICRNFLRKMDDDWIKAGMELGLIDNAVLLGVDFDHRTDENKYSDMKGGNHEIYTIGSPNNELGYQGDLSDLAREPELASLWNLLDWHCSSPPNFGFNFGASARKIILDFDLDCFMIRWQDYVFPWLDEVWEREFRTYAQVQQTQRYTGRIFFNKLLLRSGLVTIAREPECCDGDAKSDVVLCKLNKYLFDYQLKI